VATTAGRAALSPASLTGGTLVGALLVTLGVVVLPFARFAYRAPVLHVVLETAEGVVALVVAFLLYGRYRRSGQTRALLVTYALVIVAVANLLLQSLPQALGSDQGTPWASLTVRLIGVSLLTAAALTPASVRLGPVAARTGLLLCSMAVLVLTVAAVAYGDRLPDPVDPLLDLRDAVSPVVGGHPLALAAQALSGLLYAVAAVAFTRQAGRDSDELLRWLGAGCVLAAVARVNYLLFPSLYSDFVYTGDLLRLGFYLFMLVGAMREVQSYWESLSYTAVLEDRRRLARDLHDGLTQELTYIWTQSRLLAKQPGDIQAVERINGASARALDEARTAIAALSRTTTGSFAEVLRESVDGLAGRYDAAGQVLVAADVVATPAQADAVLRIVGEAFRNAVRHGGASTVEVTASGDPLTVRIRDDGQGFDPTASNTTGGGFGLTSMRERAEGVGASFDLQTAVGEGTTVEVRWP
jgi:signal transduction histidine kinase